MDGVTLTLQDLAKIASHFERYEEFWSLYTQNKGWEWVEYAKFDYIEGMAEYSPETSKDELEIARTITSDILWSFCQEMTDYPGDYEAHEVAGIQILWNKKDEVEKLAKSLAEKMKKFREKFVRRCNIGKRTIGAKTFEVVSSEGKGRIATMIGFDDNGEWKVQQYPFGF